MQLATDQVEDHIDFLSQNLLGLRLSIIDNPGGSDGVEVRLIVAACRGNRWHERVGQFYALERHRYSERFNADLVACGRGPSRGAS